MSWILMMLEHSKLEIEDIDCVERNPGVLQTFSLIGRSTNPFA